MKYRNGISQELSNGRWVKSDLELEETDIQSTAVELGLNYPAMSVLQRFKFAHRLCSMLLYSAVAEDLPNGAEAFQEARERFEGLVDGLRGGQSE